MMGRLWKVGSGMAPWRAFEMALTSDQDFDIWKGDTSSEGRKRQAQAYRVHVGIWADS